MLTALEVLGCLLVYGSGIGACSVLGGRIRGMGTFGGTLCGLAWPFALPAMVIYLAGDAQYTRMRDQAAKYRAIEKEMDDCLMVSTGELR